MRLCTPARPDIQDGGTCMALALPDSASIFQSFSGPSFGSPGGATSVGVWLGSSEAGASSSEVGLGPMGVGVSSTARGRGSGGDETARDWRR
jgi:hypothetical protein